MGYSVKKIITIVGARPQFVKAAVISRSIQASNHLTEVMVHTGQHYDSNMSDVFFEQLGIPEPKYHLAIHSKSHGAMTAAMLAEIEVILLQEKPDMVLLYGDTNSTLAGALASSKLSIPIAHVEAGLRSYNRTMPEEINRVLTDHQSDLLFCPTQRSLDNLKQEGITNGCYFVGDVMADATQYAIDQFSHDGFTPIALPTESYLLLTVHRQSSTLSLDVFETYIRYADDYAKDHNLNIVFPVHPRSKHLFDQLDMDLSRFHCMPPQGYFEFHQLLANAKLMMTDSGGVQKEAYFHRVPCVTMRSETEWQETIDCGWNRLWTEANWLPQKMIEDYGEGHSGQEMIQMIEQYLGCVCPVSA